MPPAVRLKSIIALILAWASLAPSFAHACGCIADPYSKNYAYIRKTWYGKKRKWSCNYTCEDRQGRRTQVIGWHEGWNVGEDKGLEGICDGTVYEPVFSGAKLDYVYTLKGAEWFHAESSGSPELRVWDQTYCR